jgi:hypothetical protein
VLPKLRRRPPPHGIPEPTPLKVVGERQGPQP